MSELSLGPLMDRALGAYLGLAIGDALGATVEFMTAREIAARFGVHRHMLGGGWLRLPPGQVTDDTTMSLALGDALVRHAGYDARGVADAFVRWWRGKPVDCGNTVRRGIQRYINDASLSGPVHEGDGGNGALMRNLPVALATLGDDERFCRWSLAQAHITHNHPLSDAATLALGRMVRALIRGAGTDECVGLSNALVQAHPAFRYSPYPGRASGYVVDTVQTVLHHFLAHEDFESALVATVNRGDDADTTGALVGMLAGARCGAARLPTQWLNKLHPGTRRAIADQTSALLALALQDAQLARGTMA